MSDVAGRKSGLDLFKYISLLAFGLAPLLCFQLPVFLPFVFIPLQFAYVRLGRSSGHIVSAIYIVTALAWGYFTRGIAEIGLSILIAAMSLAFVALNSKTLGTVHFSIRIPVLAIAIAVLVAPFYAFIMQMPEMGAMINEGYRELTGSITTADVSTFSNFDVVPLINALFFKILGFLVFLLVLGGWWFGSRIAIAVSTYVDGTMREKTAEAVSQGMTPPIDTSKIVMPSWLVWVFLAAWAAVLGLSALPSISGANQFEPAVLLSSSVAWNLALIVSTIYFIQGSGIVSHLRRSNHAFRFVFPILGVFLFAVIGVVISFDVALYAMFGIVAVVGVSEAWIPYRKVKGAS